MRYTASNYMGNTPATSYQNSKLINLNADLFFLYPPQIRKFIALHEEGHILLNTDSELDADNYAFKKFNNTLPQSHRWSVLSLSRILPFTNKEQYKRLLNMIKQAMIADSYETGDSINYEMSYMNKLIEDMDNMNDQEWKELNAVDPVTNEATPVTKIKAEPIGEFVPITREVWTKAVLGEELTGYDMTILDKYPVPEDFVAFQVDRNEIMNASDDTSEGESIDPAEISDSMSPTLEPVSKINKKLPVWIWILIAGFVALLIFKK